MSDIKDELVAFRIKQAEETFALAQFAVSKGYWNSAASRLYYTFYYLATALFAQFDIKTSTHSGVKTIFGSAFIQTGLIESKWGRFHSRLFNMRQQGDYSDFNNFTEADVLPLVSELH